MSAPRARIRQRRGPIATLAALGLCAAAGCIPDREVAHARANLYLRTSNISSALGVLRSEFKRAPNDVAIAAKLGRTLFLAQRYSEAETVLATVLENAPETPASAELLRALAQVKARTGRLSEAEVLLERACAQVPSGVDAWLALAALRTHREDLAGAEAALTHVLVQDGTHPSALYNYGRMLLRRGQRDDAVPYFERLRATLAAHPYGAYGLALVAARRGDEARACALLTEARRLGLHDDNALRADEAWPQSEPPHCERQGTPP